VRGTHRHHPAVAKMLRWLAFGVPADSLSRRYARNLHAAWDTAVAYRLEDSVDSGSPRRTCSNRYVPARKTSENGYETGIGRSQEATPFMAIEDAVARPALLGESDDVEHVLRPYASRGRRRVGTIRTAVAVARQSQGIQSADNWSDSLREARRRAMKPSLSVNMRAAVSSWISSDMRLSSAGVSQA
jgi:hypothetical protein